MESEPSPSLFSLSVDPGSKVHLEETARWARFLALAGMVLLSLGAGGILVVGVYTGLLSSGVDYPGMSGAYSLGIALFYFLLLGVWFFPLLFLLRFANKMKAALRGNDQEALTNAVMNLKSCFRYVGIITIIILTLYAVIIVVVLFGLAATSLS